MRGKNQKISKVISEMSIHSDKYRKVSNKYQKSTFQWLRKLYKQMYAKIMLETYHLSCDRQFYGFNPYNNLYKQVLLSAFSNEVIEVWED